jgi:AhpD family alkylhydroperoxidase
MTNEEQSLRTEEKELVAVGASVGAGCRPCVSHHLKAGAKAGLAGDRLLAAVTSAEHVNAEAAVAMGDHVRAKLGPEVTAPALLSRLEEALASVGAALGANDVTNIERHLRAASDLGASRSQLQQAIEIAHTVQENAARIHLREAERLLDTIVPASAANAAGGEPEGGCGCGADAERQQAPTDKEAREDEPPEPVAAASGKSAPCRSMAARFGSGGGFGEMAGCRRMFEQFVGASAPAETEAPVAATAAGACEKEA